VISATDGAGRCGGDGIRHAPAAATTDDKPPGNLCAEHRIRAAVPGIRATHGDASATLDWLAERLGDLVDLPRVRDTAKRLATGLRAPRKDDR
jgi:hypothetical protein